MISFLGTQVTQVALPYQIYQQTHSPLAVGTLGLVQLVPLLTLAFVGGAFADAHDRRALVLLTELAFATMSLLLLVNASAPQPALWLLYVVAGAQAGLGALQRPSLDALLPRLVERDEMPAAVALFDLRGTVAMLLGPAIGGALIAVAGLPAAYGADLLSFLISLVLLWRMRAVPPPVGAEPPSLRRIREGLVYAGRRPELMGTYIVDFVAMVFGMPSALFPALADHFGGPSVLGLLYAAPALGAFLATATSGWTRFVHRHGLAVTLAAIAWGVAIAGFGLADTLAPALALLSLAGAADAISGIFRSVIWNQTIPDALRGRLASIELLSYSSGPQLGNVEAGLVASLFSVPASVISGGVLCVVGCAACALLLPAFWRYDARRSVNEVTGQPQ